MPDREVVVQAWLAAERAAVAAEREVATLSQPNIAQLDALVESAKLRRREADDLFKQVYAAVKVEARP